MQATRLISAVVLCVAANGAFASAKCPKYPKSEWMPQAEAKAKIESQGYVVKKFKVDGNCYEIYGTKDGKKAEVYFDAKTLDVVKSEIGR